VGGAATVSSLTERELISRIQQRLPPAPDWLLVGIGDDAAVVEPERNRVDVLSVDAFVEGVHFDCAFVPPEAVGHRALAANLSDLAAMGAAPRLALLSLALPGSLALDHFDNLISGLTRLAARYRLHVSGGNLTRSPGPLMIDITVIGTVKRRQALTRGGARPGDDIYVSGTLGAAAAGLGMLKEVSLATKDATVTKEQLPARNDEPFVPVMASLVKNTCVDRYLYPEPRVPLGLVLSRNRAATAAIDLSDGLADGLYRIAEASGIGAIIDADSLPIDPDTRAWFSSCGLDPVAEAMTAGDDYELLFTVRPRSGNRIKPARLHGQVPLALIGKCTDGHAITVREGTHERELPRAGYDHFR
jgi:thiamine-monophosphate kinase